MSADRQPEPIAATSYFTDRCMAVIDGNFQAPRCGLKLGHEGPHEPIKVGKQTVSESPAATGRDTWSAGSRPWKPCPSAAPHPRHEWPDGVKREDCPGVSAASPRESQDVLGKPVPVESLLDDDDFAVIREEQASSAARRRGGR